MQVIYELSAKLWVTSVSYKTQNFIYMNKDNINNLIPRSLAASSAIAWVSAAIFAASDSCTSTTALVSSATAC